MYCIVTFKSVNNWPISIDHLNFYFVYLFLYFLYFFLGLDAKLLNILQSDVQQRQQLANINRSLSCPNEPNFRTITGNNKSIIGLVLTRKIAAGWLTLNTQYNTQIREQMSGPELSLYGKSILGCGLGWTVE